MNAWRWGRIGLAVAITSLVCLPSARGQTTSSATTSGYGVMAVPSMGANGQFGMMAIPMSTGSGSQTTGSSVAGTAADPLGLSSLYGPAMPMTPGQAGVFMLATQQRMLGLGNGKLSGVRPGPSPEPRGRSGVPNKTETRADGAHTRDSNVPGGQASRFFNRSGLAARSHPFANRQSRYFPQNGH